MVQGLSRSHTSIALLDDEADAARSVTCPMCHVDAPLTQSALAAGGAWRCVRCGQHWDGDRLTAVAEYAVWVADRDRAGAKTAEHSQTAAQYRNPPTHREDGTV
jgi:ribosomal protein L37AE/L43A